LVAIKIRNSPWNTSMATTQTELASNTEAPAATAVKVIAKKRNSICAVCRA